MRELVALEYREEDWSTPGRLAKRVAEVADRCVAADLGAVGVAGLLRGRLATEVGPDGPVVVFGLRAATPAAVVAVASVLAVRGFGGIYTWTDEADEATRAIDPRLVVGHGMVEARGGTHELFDASLAEIRRLLEDESTRPYPKGANIWMPAPDRFDRAVDGVFLEEAARRDVDLVWVPGDGLNSVEETGMQLVEGRVDDGTYDTDLIGRWARGERVGRGRLRVTELVRRPRRWLREIAGLR